MPGRRSSNGRGDDQLWRSSAKNSLSSPDSHLSFHRHLSSSPRPEPRSIRRQSHTASLPYNGGLVHTMDPADSNQLIMSSSASSPGPQSALSSTSSASTVKARPGPLHLQPPTGINILPPSPIDPRNGSPFSSSPVEVESPESTSDTEEQAPRDKSRSRLTRLSAHALSTLPTKAHCLLLSPQISRTISNDSSGSASSTGTLGSRAPTPSSPGYRPKRTHHRRTSSTHRVRETVDGEQKTTAEGRLVNQYRIGKSLGKGAYAKVELGVDITTGTEYVSVVKNLRFRWPLARDSQR